MKGLTIEQKAKAYDEAIERIENIMTGKCETTFMFTKGLFEHIFPELAESEDEKVRKELLLDIPKVFPHDKAVRYIAYLEKQCESTDIPADAVLDENKDGLIADTIRLKPKFKVGDWVVQGSIILKIRCVGNERYCYETVGGYVDDMLVSEIDSLYHLWTIQDAKGGDVLACDDEDKVFIYNGKLDLKGRVCAYCGVYKTYDELRFTECAIGNSFTYKKPHPATKEQRDTLMKAMTDAGYTFDFEKKELKKIEPKPWSEDDEAILSWCISDIERAKYCRSQTKPELCDIEINWLKSRVGCELKRATTCRPSEEEMKALEFCIEHNIDKDGIFGSKVVKLYEKLKKLRGG